MQTSSVKAYLNDRKAGKTEWLVLAVWILLVCIIRHFHETWFDETQAWQIARYASLKELLTEVEHYEGHPPLWHMLLMPFAKAGFPYKITIFCINLLFNVAALFLLLFRSPLPRWLRCSLPFHYYIFYQHGVHTRPYSLMMLAMFLAAMAYPRRNEKPGRYILSLILLCFTCAYGVLIAGGLCMVWLYEILRTYAAHKNFSRIPKDARFWWMALILAVALLLYSCMSPAEDVHNSTTYVTFSDNLKNLHFFLLLLFDTAFGTILPNTGEYHYSSMYFIGDVIGLLLWVLLIPLLHKNRKLLVFLLPYTLLTGFSVFVYFWGHHMEIYHMFFIFTLWVLYQDPVELPEFYGKIKSKIDSPLTFVLMKTIAAAALCMPLVHSAGASILEIRHRFGPLEIVNFIKDNHLENRKILTYWEYITDHPEDETMQLSDLVNYEKLPYDSPAPIKDHNTTTMSDPINVDAYFDKLDCFPYFDVLNGGKRYITGRLETPQEAEEDFAKWREIGLPDFVISPAPIQEVFPPEMLDGVTYYWIETCHFGTIWKLEYTEGLDNIYIRGDLLGEYPQFHVKTFAEEAKKP